MSERDSLWVQQSRQWAAVGSPQRPCAEDVEMLFALAQPLLTVAAVEPLVIGVLGVTPELVRGPWPEGISLHAFERSAAMIARHWSSEPSCDREVHQAHWHDLPLASGALTLVVGDGCTTQFPDRAYYTAFFSEMHRLLRPEGGLVMRCFLQPECSSPSLGSDPAAIVGAVWNGCIEQFGTLKWRLAMALSDPHTLEVPVRDIHAAFCQHLPDRDALAQHTNWERATIDTIDAYQNSDDVYTFPSLHELQGLAAPWFALETMRLGHYELAQSCPVLRLRRLAQPGQGAV